MIHSLEIRSVRLMTNNPEKISQLVSHGVEVTSRLPHVIPPNEFNRFYLETKADRSGHWIDFQGKTHLPEQSDPVVVGVEDDG
jgi:GTP cyclohydrolase II